MLCVHGGASIAIENGNLLMQENLVMTSAYTVCRYGLAGKY